eukprot:TRINITY_DN2255_c0_g1_i1.p1 TRINITY_DN2255_c0_g1~~TRINITY_DN2255_c0_g1_i1.p1  ORF type:complete len:847 (+),score=243.94 TRINITY_DN2255_c0_g1_i1:87-2543(+)
MGEPAEQAGAGAPQQGEPAPGAKRSRSESDDPAPRQRSRGLDGQPAGPAAGAPPPLTREDSAAVVSRGRAICTQQDQASRIENLQAEVRQLKKSMRLSEQAHNSKVKLLEERLKAFEEQAGAGAGSGAEQAVVDSAQTFVERLRQSAGNYAAALQGLFGQYSAQMQDAAEQAPRRAAAAAPAEPGPCAECELLRKSQREFSDMLDKKVSECTELRIRADVVEQTSADYKARAAQADELEKRLQQAESDRALALEAGVMRKRLEEVQEELASLKGSVAAGWAEWETLYAEAALPSPVRKPGAPYPEGAARAVSDKMSTCIREAAEKSKRAEQQCAELQSQLKEAIDNAGNAERAQVLCAEQLEQCKLACATQKSLADMRQGHLDKTEQLVKLLATMLKDASKGEGKGGKAYGPTAQSLSRLCDHFITSHRDLQQGASLALRKQLEQAKEKNTKAARDLKAMHAKSTKLLRNLIDSESQKRVREHAAQIAQELSELATAMRSAPPDAPAAQSADTHAQVRKEIAAVTGWLVEKLPDGGSAAELTAVDKGIRLVIAEDGKIAPQEEGADLPTDVHPGVCTPAALARILCAALSREPLLCLMRHGVRADGEGMTPPEGAWPDRESRPYDPPLAEGKDSVVLAAAEALREHGVSGVACSPLRRCIQTAGIICRALGLREVVVREGLQECPLALSRCNPTGEAATFLSDAEAKAAVGPGVSLQWPGRTGRASSESVQRRVEREIPRMWNEHCRRSGAMGGTLVLVTHGDVVNSYLPPIEGVPDIGRYTAEEAGWALLRLGQSTAAPKRVTTDDRIVQTHRVSTL